MNKVMIACGLSSIISSMIIVWFSASSVSIVLFVLGLILIILHEILL